MKLKPKQYLRVGLNVLLLGGMVFLTGFLSFTGMLVINSSIYLAVAAFMLGGVIEGEVYAQNIHKSLLKLFTGEYIEDLIITRELNQLVQKKENLDKSQFLQLYNESQHALNKLQHQNNPDQKKLQALQKRRKWMRRYFIKFLRDQQEDFNYIGTISIDKKKKTEILNEISRKKWLSRVTLALTTIPGCSAGLVAISTIQTGLASLALYLGITITSTLMAASVYGLAILAAAGYILLIYNNLTDIINNDTIQKYAKETKQFFHQKENEYVLIYYSRCVGAVLGTAAILGIGIFATVATAGTWWIAAKKGAEWSPLLIRAAQGLRDITVPAMTMTNLIFTVTNSFQSIKELAKISIQEHYSVIKKKIKGYIDAEHVAQLVNIPRLVFLLISVPFKLVVFLLHLVAMGLMGDRLKGVNPELCTGINTLNEGAQDAHYFMPEHEHHEHHHHERKKKHKSENPHKCENHALNEKIETKEKHDHHKHHHHDHAHQHEEHDHNHTDIAGKFLMVALTIVPLIPLSAVWDSAASQFNDDVKKQLTFWAALTKAYCGLQKPAADKKEKVADANPKLEAWHQVEKKLKLTRVLEKARFPVGKIEKKRDQAFSKKPNWAKIFKGHAALQDKAEEIMKSYASPAA